MPAFVGKDREHKKVTALSVGVGDVHKDVIGGWVGVSGAWKKFWGWPDNYVFLYKDAADVPAGGTRLSAWDDKFVRAITSGAVAAEGGSDTHDGSDHGEYAGNSGTISNSRNFTDESLSSCYCNTQSTHQHSITHTLAADGVSIIPEYLALLAYTGVAKGEGALFMFDGPTVPSGWTQYLLHTGRFIRFASAFGTGGAGSHDHVFVGNTGNANYTQSQRSRCRNDYWYRHAMVMDHTHTDLNVPSYIDVLLIYKSGPIQFDDLPSGTVGLFNSSSIPVGWSLWSAAHQRFLKHRPAGSGGTGGSDTHTTSFVGNTGSWTNTSSREGNNGSSRYNLSSAVHVMDHTHPTAANILPAYKDLYIAKKD